MKKTVINPWVNKIWFHINKGALANEGKPFSFEIEIVTKYLDYQFSSTDLLPRWKKFRERKSLDELGQFEQAAKQMPLGFATAKHFLMLKDTRTKKPDIDFGYAEVKEGYKFNCSVDAILSSKVYDNYAQNGKVFKEKLLKDYYHLLQKLHYNNRGSSKIIDTPSFTAPNVGYIAKTRFSVKTDGVYKGSNSDINITYSQIGMTDLSSGAQCYGMALALIEMNRPAWEKLGDLKIEFIPSELNPDNITVNYWLVHNESSLPKLSQW